MCPMFVQTFMSSQNGTLITKSPEFITTFSSEILWGGLEKVPGIHDIFLILFI